jgi:ferritin heavy chain
VSLPPVRSIELTISYVYMSLHSYADRDNVGLPGFAAWFKEESDAERDHAQLLLNFQVHHRLDHRSCHASV